MQSIRSLYLAKSLKLAKSRSSLLGLMVLFDMLFIIAGAILFYLSAGFANTLFLNNDTTAFIVYLALSLFYYILILFIYSFFKYCILNAVKSLFEKSELNFKNLGNFFMLNIILGGIFFSGIFVLNLILYISKISYKPYMLFIVGIPMIVFSYIFLGMSHSFFYLGNGIGKSLSRSLKITFGNLKIYKETILLMFISTLLLLVLFGIAGYILRVSTTGNYFNYLTAYAYFKEITSILAILLAYFFILENRIVFYMFARENFN